MVDIAGHLFYVALIGKGKRIGWLVRLVGEIGWTVIGFVIGMTPIPG